MKEQADWGGGTSTICYFWHNATKHPIGDLIGFRIGNKEKDQGAVKTVLCLQKNIHLRSFLVWVFEILLLRLPPRVNLVWQPGVAVLSGI